MFNRKWGSLTCSVSFMAAAVFLAAFSCACRPVSVFAAADVIVITADEIKRMNVQKISGVLNQVSGIKAGESFVSIWGSYKVKVLLDGRPINDPSSSHNAVKFDLVSLENIEKIEVLRGEGALKYGDDASAGVILITTKRIGAFRGNVKSYRGNFGTSSYSANCRAIKGSFGVSASLGYDSTDGYKVNNDRKKKRAGGKIEYLPDEKLSVAFSADYLKDKMGLSGRPEYPTSHSRKESDMLSCALSVKAKGIKSKTFYNEGDTQNRDTDRNINNSMSVRDFGEDLYSSLDMGPWGTINYGAAFRWGAAESSRFASQREYSTSFFAANVFSIKPLPVTFSLGFRGSLYSDFDNTLNPEVKISHTGKGWSLSFAYNRVSNTPSFYQRYDKTSAKEPNPDLAIETADNLNVSFFVEVSPRISLGTSLFYNSIADRITYVLGKDGIGRYENFGKVTYRGADLLLSWKIMKELSLKTTYTFLRAMDEDTGLWMACKPRHRVYADLFFRPIKDFSIVLNMKYESGQYTRSDNKASVEGRAIFNLRFEYSPAWAVLGFGRFELFGEVNNMANKTYLYGDGLLAPPRTWFCGFNFQF